MIKKTHRLFKQWKKSLKDSAYVKYKEIRNKLSNQIKYAKHNASPGGYVKSKSSQTLSAIKMSPPTPLLTLLICLVAFFFLNVLTGTMYLTLWFPDYNVTSSISHFTCYPTDVIKLIRKLDNNSAAGVDGITSIMLKNTATSVSPLPTHLFNLSISTGSVPSAWKLSRVIPTFKLGDR